MTYPIEYTKTMQQLATTKMSGMDVIRNTLKDKGPFGMYRGLSSMVWFAGPKAGVRFTGFEYVNSSLPSELGAFKGFFAGLGKFVSRSYDTIVLVAKLNKTYILKCFVVR